MNDLESTTPRLRYASLVASERSDWGEAALPALGWLRVMISAQNYARLHPEPA